MKEQGITKWKDKFNKILEEALLNFPDFPAPSNSRFSALQAFYNSELNRARINFLFIKGNWNFCYIRNWFYITNIHTYARTPSFSS